MPVVKDHISKPLNKTETYVLGIAAGNATDVYIWTAGVTDLTIFVKNTHASAEMTLSIDWHMNEAEAVASYIDAIGSDPTIAFGAIDHWRFGSGFLTFTTDVLIDPYFADVLPCNWIKLRMFGTSAAGSCQIWLQGHKRRL